MSVIAGVEWAPKEREILTSIRGWEEFLESPVWADIKGHFEDLRFQLYQALKSPDIADSLERVREFQAGLRICDEVLGLPESFILDIRTQLDKLQQEEQEEDNAWRG